MRTVTWIALLPLWLTFFAPTDGAFATEAATDSLIPHSSDRLSNQRLIEPLTESMRADGAVKDEVDDKGFDSLGVELAGLGFSRTVVEQTRLVFEQTAGEAADLGDPLSAWVTAAASAIPEMETWLQEAAGDPLAAAESLDPSARGYEMLQSLPPRLRAATATWLGRLLVQRRYFDEALPVLAEVDPQTCPDAASLLFYRGSSYHALLKKTEALRDLRQLTQLKTGLPVRFERTAALMIADLKPLKEDSLDEVSRLMTDVSRRLDLGRVGESTQTKEQEIIDKLSKLIDDLEKQQQQQQQQQQQAQSSGGGGGAPQGGQAGDPMADSQIAGAAGNGDVDPKSLQDTGGWGNLPPAERRESLQQINRDLPTHYRDAIEAYFRKMAQQS